MARNKRGNNSMQHTQSPQGRANQYRGSLPSENNHPQLSRSRWVPRNSSSNAAAPDLVQLLQDIEANRREYQETISKLEAEVQKLTRQLEEKEKMLRCQICFREPEESSLPGLQGGYLGGIASLFSRSDTMTRITLPFRPRDQRGDDGHAQDIWGDPLGGSNPGANESRQPDARPTATGRNNYQLLAGTTGIFNSRWSRPEQLVSGQEQNSSGASVGSSVHSSPHEFSFAPVGQHYSPPSMNNASARAYSEAPSLQETWTPPPTPLPTPPATDQGGNPAQLAHSGASTVTVAGGALGDIPHAHPNPPQWTSATHEASIGDGNTTRNSDDTGLSRRPTPERYIPPPIRGRNIAVDSDKPRRPMFAHGPNLLSPAISEDTSRALGLLAGRVSSLRPRPLSERMEAKAALESLRILTLEAIGLLKDLYNHQRQHDNDPPGTINRDMFNTNLPTLYNLDALYEHITTWVENFDSNPSGVYGNFRPTLQSLRVYQLLQLGKELDRVRCHICAACMNGQEMCVTRGRFFCMDCSRRNGLIGNGRA
ncbi:hypothetical protein B0T16DRAFT_389571 [Cercophora newfieldiana]|uniref:Uncharacterized protein n=1 Tax=Cercophora newfieldiana TaxID=92897 RepID=A0AA39YC22_9PEZI|nr:hypothetical protein B0T16DRAFT_389571 [Cercophora newfieldiana]